MEEIFPYRCHTLIVSACLILSACNQNEGQKDQNVIPAAEAKSLAKDAFLFGMPLVFIEMQFDFNSHATKTGGTKAPVNQFAHARAFLDASNKTVIGPNVDNLYSLASIDLTIEPVILSTPEMGNRYWEMQIIDAWNDVIAVPGSRTLGSKAGIFGIVGPGWKGQLPQGIVELKCPTRLALIAGRTYCSGKSDYPAVNKLQDQYKLIPVSQWGKDYKVPGLVPLKAGINETTSVKNQFMALPAEKFFKNLNRLLADNPGNPGDSPILKRIEKIGIKAGANFKMDSLRPELAMAIEEGYAEGFRVMFDEAGRLGKIENGWSLTYDLGRYGTNYPYRALWTFIGIGGNLLEDAFYPTAQVDGNANALNAANKYTLTFARDKLPPAAGFWSLTMYDIEGHLAANKLNRYALGDRKKMKFASDGSLTIYIQKEDPGNVRQSNWLPAPGSGAFRLGLRLYAPKQIVLDRSWSPPPVIKIN
ncbi:MAG: DUF1254 domain-containing protein [Chitinophagales bacterium]